MRSLGYWLSPSVLTRMSAPSSRALITPSWNDLPSPDVPRVVDDVLDAECPGDLDGPITRAVIDDQKLEFVHPLDVPGHLLEDEGERGLLVEARDLDDYLHAGSPVKEPMP